MKIVVNKSFNSTSVSFIKQERRLYGSITNHCEILLIQVCSKKARPHEWHVEYWNNNKLKTRRRFDVGVPFKKLREIRDIIFIDFL